MLILAPCQPSQAEKAPDPRTPPSPGSDTGGTEGFYHSTDFPVITSFYEGQGPDPDDILGGH